MSPFRRNNVRKTQTAVCYPKHFPKQPDNPSPRAYPLIWGSCQGTYVDQDNATSKHEVEKGALSLLSLRKSRAKQYKSILSWLTAYDMAPIKSIEYFRVKPRWLFVKISDDHGQVGWGEGTLEGHSLAVEGALDELRVRLVGMEAK